MKSESTRDGFRTVTPYLLVEGADRLITFLCEAFAANVRCREARPDGSVMHSELRVGDSMLMLGEANDEFGPMPTSIYLYVPDCDSVYQQALKAGGNSVFELMDMPSGERYGGVKDPAGNIWWIATHIEDVSPEEQERRWREFRR
jgi:PhnB protein